MATRKPKLINHETGKTEEVNNEEFMPEEDFSQAKLEGYYNEFIANADEAYNFRVKKIIQGQKEYGHCFIYTVTQYTFIEVLEKVAREYGSGEYRIMVYDAAGKVRWNRQFFITGKLNESEVLDKKSVNMELFNKLFEQNQQMSDRLERALESKKPPINLMELLTIAPPIILAIREFIPKNNAMTAQDMLSIMQALREMTPPANEDKSDNFSQTVLKAMDIFGKPMVDASQKQINEKLNYLINENNALKSQLGLPNTKEIEHDLAPQNDSNRSREKIVNLITMAKNGVKAGAEAGEYAQFFIDQLDETELLNFATIAASPNDCFNILSSFDSNIMPYKDWFIELINEFNTLYNANLTKGNNTAINE